MPIRIGIVGCGAIHGTHAKAIGRIGDASVSGFYDVDPERSAKAAVVFGATAFPTFEDLCKHSDAISVCVPSGLHAEVGIAAAKRGLHVLVEKPIEVSLSSAIALIEACRTAGVKLSVISQHRFAPDLMRLKDAVDSGELGHMIEGDAYIKWYRTQHYYDSGDWRGTWKLDGGGCLINQGVHYIDMIQWIMGGVSSVQAQVSTSAHSIEVEDVAAALVEYNNGAIGVIQGSTSFFPGFAERLELHGRNGSVIVEGDQAVVWEIDDPTADDGSLYGRGVTMQPTPNLRQAARAEEMSTESRADLWIERHRSQIQDFVEAIQDDRLPSITGESALEPLKVIMAIYESARLGGAKVSIGESSLSQ